MQDESSRSMHDVHDVCVRGEEMAAAEMRMLFVMHAVCGAGAGRGGRGIHRRHPASRASSAGLTQVLKQCFLG